MEVEITDPAGLAEESAEYRLSFQHAVNPTISLQVVVGMGDSGATSAQADEVTTALITAILADPDFTYSEGTKTFDANRSILISTN